MLVVKIEIWPLGDERGAKEICRGYIANDGKMSAQTGSVYGSYDAKFMQSSQFDPGKVWRKGRAERIHRSLRGPWDILYSCLRSAGLDKRNPEANPREEKSKDGR